MTARILLVEDNPDLARGLQQNLEFEGYRVEVAEDGGAGLETARSGDFDLVILDLMLPEVEGFELLASLRRESRVPVLILTARGGELDRVRGLRLGADDYVTKPFSVLELMARVEAILRRSSSRGHGRTYRFARIEVDTAARTVKRRGDALSLTPKEFDLLVALLERDGAVASRKELLREVWGHKAAIESRTVDTHIAELRKKLEDDPSDPRHILTVRKAGYRLRRPAG